MRSDEQMEAMEAGEDSAVVRALKTGATPAPEFRARFKQSFLSEAESDARRRKAYKLSILGLPRFYINLAAVGAAAALVLTALTYSVWFRPAHTLKTAEELRQSVAVTEQADSEPHNMLLGPRSGARGFAPDAGDIADAVYVECSTPLTDEVQGTLELIAVEAGGAVECAGAGGSAGEAQAIVLTVPSDVLDHVIGRLGQVIGTAKVSQPVHLNSKQVTVYITFSPD